MRTLLICFVIFIFCDSSFAQSNFYLKKDNKITFHNYNGKDREVNFKEIFTDSTQVKNGDTISYCWSRVSMLRGFKREPYPGKYKSERRIAAKKNDAGFYLNYATIASGEDDNMSRSITVDILEDQFLFYPKTMAVGQSIEGTIDVSGNVVYYQSDWSANNSAQVQGRTFAQARPDVRKSKVYVRITDRKVVGTEALKIGDKSVDCFVIEHTVASTAREGGNYKAEAKVKEWYSPIYGLLQIEKYNTKDKLEATSKIETL